MRTCERVHQIFSQFSILSFTSPFLPVAFSTVASGERSVSRALFFVVFQGGQRATDHKDQIAPLNFLPAGQNARDHAEHPRCRVCLLPRPFPAVQAMPEVHPCAEMERGRRSHRVCQVRRPHAWSSICVWPCVLGRNDT